MITEVINSAFSYDAPLASTRDGAPAREEIEALRSLLDDSGVAPLVSTLPSPDDWRSIFAGLEQLATAEAAAGEYMDWVDLARRSEELAQTRPVAAVIATLYGVAAWEGGVDGNIYDHRGTRLPQPSWKTLVLPLARNLLRADAIWTARLVADRGLEALHDSDYAAWQDDLRCCAAEYNQVRADAEHVVREAVRSLAWDLRAACRGEESSFAPETAALLWTLGDPVHAARVAAGHPPSPALCEWLVEQAVLRRIEADPFAQYIWLAMKDRPPLDLRAHALLFSRINAVYEGTRAHLLDQIHDPAPSAVYAQSAIAYFRGDLNDELRDQLGVVVGTFGDMLLNLHPHFGVRLMALATLVLYDGSDDQVERWRYLAREGSRAVDGTRNAGIYDPYDRSLDSPYAYLPAEVQDEFEETLDALDLYRFAGIHHWLVITKPAPPDDPAADALLAEEGELLQELRGARFMRLVPSLPRHYQRYNYVIQGGPPENPFDQARAVQRLGRISNAMNEVWRKLDEVAPVYSKQRRLPRPSLDEFVELVDYPFGVSSSASS